MAGPFRYCLNLSFLMNDLSWPSTDVPSRPPQIPQLAQAVRGSDQARYSFLPPDKVMPFFPNSLLELKYSWPPFSGLDFRPIRSGQVVLQLGL